MAARTEESTRLGLSPDKLRNGYAYFRAGSDEVVVEYHPLQVRGAPAHHILSGRAVGLGEELGTETALEDASDEQLQLENGHVHPDNMWPVYRGLGYEPAEEAVKAPRDDPAAFHARSKEKGL